MIPVDKPKSSAIFSWSMPCSTISNNYDPNIICNYIEGANKSVGEKTKLDVAINKEDWEKAAGGTYKTAITFTISYVDKE